MSIATERLYAVSPQDVLLVPIEALSIIRMQESIPARRKRLANASEYEQWKMRAQMAMYPQDSPVTHYVAGLIDKLGGRLSETGASVTVYRGEPNAFIFPTGDTYISDGLLKLAENDEEVMFVLGHERRHFKERHTEKAHKLADKHELAEAGDIERALSSAGQSRIHEWQADLASFDDLNEMGYNPLSSIHFTERLLEKEESERDHQSDEAHGKTVDRALNMRLMTHLKDLKSINEPFHPIPDEVKQTITEVEEQNLYVSPIRNFIRNIRQGIYGRAFDNIAKMDTGSLLVILPDVFNDYQKRISEVGKRFGQRDLVTSQYECMLTNMGKQIWEQILATDFDGTTLTSQQVSILFSTILSVNAGIPVEEQSALFSTALTVYDKSRKTDVPWDAQKFSLEVQVYSDEDIEEVLTILNPKIYAKLGLYLNEVPTAYAETVQNLGLNNYVFEDEDGNFQNEKYLDFVDQFIAKLESLYSEQGTERFEADTLYERLVKKTIKFIPLKEDQQSLLDDAQKRRPQVFKETTAQEASSSTDKLVQFLINIDSKYKGDLLDALDVRSEFKDLIESISIKDPNEYLKVLATFRKALQNNPDLWSLHEVWDERLCLHMTLVSVDYISSHFSDLPKIEQMFLYLKTGLLLAHDEKSSFLLYASGIYNIEDMYKDDNFDTRRFREFYKLLTDSEALGKELGIPITTATGDNSELFPDWLKASKLSALERLFLTATKEEFSAELEQLTIAYSMNHFQEDLPNPGRTGIEAGVIKMRFLREVFSKGNFDLSNPQHLKDLYYLSTYIDNPSIAIRLQNVVLEKMGETMTFEDAFNFLQEEVNGRRLISLQAVSNLIEHKSMSHEEIELARAKILESLTSDNSTEGFGKLVHAERLTDRFYRNNKLDMLLACIGNGQDDRQLKQWLYKMWVDAYNLDDYKTPQVLHLDDLQQRLYRLDAQTKYVLIRELLIGDKGVFVDKDKSKREKFIDYFLDNFIEVKTPDDERFLGVMRQVLREVVQTASYDLLYFAISPILQDRILKQTSKSIGWKEVIRSEEPPNRLRGYIHVRYFRDGVEIKSDDVEEEEYDTLDREADMDADNLIEAIYDYPVNNIRRVERWTISTGNEELVENLIVGSEKIDDVQEADGYRREYETNIVNLLQNYETENTHSRMTVNEFILEGAQKLGAPGIRFLQLLGQYIAVSPELEQMFSGVYDQVDGQYKMTAHQTLLREWPEARDAIAGLNDRLGGGSLMSVFSATTGEGQERVIKVLNPNSGYHTENTHQLLSTVFTTLANQDPRYAPALALLDDIRDWIKEDIDFSGFLEQDRRFRRKHDGFNARGRYSIRIPESYGPSSPYFINEDFVPGINLTNLHQLQAEGHDTQQVVSLLAKVFFKQMEDGLVHSDLHPGNIRVTPQDEVALLDRNFYLQFSIRERFGLRVLAGSLGDTKKAIQSALDYISSHGTQIDDIVKRRILDQSWKLDQMEDPADKLAGLAVMLRKEGLRFPLKTTLLIKDFFYLDRLAKRVGYSGLTEAYKT